MKKCFVALTFILFFILPPGVSAESYTCSVNNGVVSKTDKSFFGINTVINQLRDKSSQEMSDYFKLISEAGIYQIRIDIQWPNVEAKQNTFNWNFYDSLFKLAKFQNLQVVPVLVGVPDWAKDNGKVNIDPKNISDWKVFVQEAVRRYNIRSGTVARVSANWEVWNEPDNSSFFEGTPQNIVSILNQSYTFIKSVDKQAVVWSPATNNFDVNGSPGTNKFFEAIVKNGTFDVLNVHLYAQIDNTVKLTGQIRDYLHQNGSVSTKGVPLAVSETNSSAILNNCFSINNLTDKELSQTIIDRYACLDVNQVKYAFYFAATDWNTKNCQSGVAKIGIVDRNFKTRPAYFDLQKMIQTVTSFKPGDFNSDGKVNFDDFIYIKDNFVKAALTIFDYNNLVTNYGK